MTTGMLRRLGAYDLGDELQDLCQEVVWALVRAVREGRAPAEHAVGSYIGSVVHNQFVTWLRRRSTRPQENVGACDPEGEITSSHVVAGATAERELADDRLAARRALSRLPREWQSLLVAHYVEGCTVDNLVSVNGTSRATLNRELQRAREAFHVAWSGRRGKS